MYVLKNTFITNAYICTAQLFNVFTLLRS